MAQFSSLEQMTNMNTAMQTMQSSNRAAEAYSLLGKRVDVFNPVTADIISGTVSRVAMRENTFVLTVNNREVELGNVQAVYSSENGRRSGAGGEGGSSAER
jgi:flagellar hook assembly protein FlgD